MSPLTPEALALSKDLAAELGQGIKRIGRAFYVPSRTANGLTYRVDWALDGSLLCNCTGYAMRRDCWHTALIREELSMNDTASRELVPMPMKAPTSLLPSKADLDTIDRTAKMVFAGAVQLPKELNTPQKVAAVMLYGLELGLPPMTAIQHLYIVHGRVQPSAEVMAGLLLSKHPDVRLSVVELTNERCEMRLQWPSRGVDDRYVVTWDDIKRAKLDHDVALLYPQDRMRWHCTKRLMRIYAPDVINGLEQGGPAIEVDEAVEYTTADGRPINIETGEIIEGEVIEHGATLEVGAAARSATVNAATGATPPATPPDETDVPMSTQEQQAAIREWEEQIQERHKAPTLIACRNWLKATFAYAFQSQFRLSLLTEDSAARYVRLLKHVAMSKEPVVPQIHQDPDHDFVYGADPDVARCTVCNLALDDGEEAAQTTLPV